MLYITTRNERDVYTAARPLAAERGTEGGLFLPFRGPELGELEPQVPSFNGYVAAVLNRFFRKQLTAWEIDCAIGRNPVRFTSLSHRILIAELWHNPAGEYRFLEDHLLGLLGGGEGWPRIAIRVALLTAISRELSRQGIVRVDMSTLTGDLRWAVSARYARDWGVELGQIICTCNENQSFWELISHGQLRTDTVAVPTGVPEGDVAFPVELERLIWAAGGRAETERYLEIRARGGLYVPGEQVLEGLRQGLSVRVVSAGRVETTIPSVVRTHQYRLSPGAALAYGGLLDYRAQSGSIGSAMVLAEKRG